MRTLVAYFSCSGVTKRIAELISKTINADLHEIEPAEPYTEEDLDWMNPESRSSIEMQYLDSRPDIKRYISNMNEYDKIIVGFPIWWYEAPTIICSFLESYDMNNKTIIPFATSGSSLYGDSNINLSKSLPKSAVLKDGTLLSLKSDDEIIDWAKSL